MSSEVGITERGEAEQAKLFIDLPAGAWHGYAVESLWITLRDDRTGIIDSVPFFAGGLAYGDVVEFTEREGARVMTRVVEPSGHLTVRIALLEGQSHTSGRAKDGMDALRSLGCDIENCNDILFAVNIPPEADRARVRDVLTRGQDGAWEVEMDFHL